MKKVGTMGEYIFKVNKTSVICRNGGPLGSFIKNYI